MIRFSFGIIWVGDIWVDVVEDIDIFEVFKFVGMASFFFLKVIIYLSCKKL